MHKIAQYYFFKEEDLQFYESDDYEIIFDIIVDITLEAVFQSFWNLAWVPIILSLHLG